MTRRETAMMPDSGKGERDDEQDAADRQVSFRQPDLGLGADLGGVERGFGDRGQGVEPRHGERAPVVRAQPRHRPADQGGEDLRAPA